MKGIFAGIALAALAPGAAMAQSSVSITGYLKLGFSASKFSNGTAALAGADPSNPTNNGSIIGMPDGASRFYFSGTEDLGGGLKAFFQIEQRFRGDESPASLQANGATFVGLSGDLGQVRFGKLDLYYGLGVDEHGSRATALQHSNIGILSYVNGTNGIARTTRTMNVVRYETPILGGTVFGLAWSPSANNGEGGANGLTGVAQKGQTWESDIRFDRGAVRIGAAYWDEKTEGYQTFAAGANTGQRAARLWAGYNFGDFDIALTLDQSKFVGNEVKRTAWSLPLKANLGVGTVLFTYTSAGDTKTRGTTNPNTGARLYSVGYDYAFSKRTSIGISYGYLDNKPSALYGLYTGTTLGSIANPTAGQDVRQLYAGMRHSF